MNTKKLFLLSVVCLMTFTGCGKKNNKTSNAVSSVLSNASLISENGNSLTSTVSGNGTTSKVTTSSSQGTVISTSQDVNNDAYDDSYSEAGHMYIHYYRADATMDDYNQYGLWLWPVSKQGALFAGSKPSKIVNVNGSGWMTSIGDKGAIDEAGVCMDIDLSETYKAGKIDSDVSFENLERIGYLVVKLDSMDGQTHWTSDGGGDAFIENVSANTRKNGSIHVFLKSGSCKTPSYVYSSKIVVNPVVEDTTGKYRSTSNIESSKDKYANTNTSKKFYESGKVGYQLFIPSFADSNGDNFGDLRGVINNIQYLKDMNIDTLWLSPFLKANSYHGYDTVDYYSIDSRFGTMDDLNELLVLCHKNNIKVLMDLVINHSSTNSVWFQKAQMGETFVGQDGKTYSYRDLFHFKYKGDTTGSGKLVENDPDWYQDGESNYYYYAKFASNMPEFNYDAEITRELVSQVALYWLGVGIDGYRLDAIKHIYMADESTKADGDSIIDDISEVSSYDEEIGQMVTKTVDYSVNTTKNVIFWKDFANRVKAIYPDCYMVGENFDGWDERIAPYYQAIDSQFDFNEYYHNQEYLYGGQGSAYKLASDNSTKYNTYYSAQRSDFINATFTSNHDVARAINHINDSDKIIGTTEQLNKAKVHAAITILQPGISYIYYGDELGMSANTGENENAYNNCIDRYYRQAFKWKEESARCIYEFGEGYSNAYDSYNASIEDYETQAANADSMYSFYKALTAVKSSADFPQNGTYSAYLYGDNANIYYCVLTPKDAGDKTYRIIINTQGSGTTTFSVDSNEQLVYSYNVSGSNVNPYGVAVIKSK